MSAIDETVTSTRHPGAAVPSGRRPGRRKVWSAERGGWAGLLLAGPMIVFVAILLVYPLARLVDISLGPPDGLGNIGEFFESDANLRVLRITFVDSAIVTAISVTVGGVIAWTLVTTRRATTRALIWAALILPFLMGTVNKLFALGVILQAKGIVNETLIALGIIDEPLKLLYNQFAVVLGMTYQMLPFAVLPLYASFRLINPELVLAAESLGASRIRAICNTVIPLAMPSVMASATIVFMVSVGFLLTPVLLGGATAPFLASFISSSLFDYYDVPGATVTALILLAASMIVIAVSYLLLGRERLARAVAQ